MGRRYGMRRHPGQRRKQPIEPGEWAVIAALLACIGLVIWEILT